MRVSDVSVDWGDSNDDDDVVVVVAVADENVDGEMTCRRSSSKARM